MQLKLFPTHAQQQFRLKENPSSLQRRRGALKSNQSLVVKLETFLFPFRFSSKLTHHLQLQVLRPFGILQMSKFITHTKGFLKKLFSIKDLLVDKISTP